MYHLALKSPPLFTHIIPANKALPNRRHIKTHTIIPRSHRRNHRRHSNESWPSIFRVLVFLVGCLHSLPFILPQDIEIHKQCFRLRTIYILAMNEYVAFRHKKIDDWAALHHLPAAVYFGHSVKPRVRVFFVKPQQVYTTHPHPPKIRPWCNAAARTSLC